MKLTSALLTGLLLSACAKEPPPPPSAVEVRVPVPVPCRVPEPQCSTPAYDGARPEMAGDQKVKLLRAETAEQADCLRLYRGALAACRAAGAPGSP